MVKAICKEILPNKDLLGGKLLCCPENGNCVPSPASCSSTDTLARCNKIGQVEACSRTDPTAQAVCQHKDGLVCSEGQAVYTGQSSDLGPVDTRSLVIDTMLGVGSLQ